MGGVARVDSMRQGSGIGGQECGRHHVRVFNEAREGGRLHTSAFNEARERNLRAEGWEATHT